MGFQETLHKHLDAIKNRDLISLRETLPNDEIQVVQSNGNLLRTTKEFIEAHEDWFLDDDWQIKFETISVIEKPEMAIALLRLAYTFTPPKSTTKAVHESYLSLVFIRETVFVPGPGINLGHRWVMVHDQNTPACWTNP